MITIKKAAGAKVMTIEELMDGIDAALEKIDGVVTGDRKDSVDSHLRACMRMLGYKPRETKDDDGKVTTTLAELHKQLEACIDATAEVTEAQHEHLHLHLTATNSNCAAEVGMKIAPELKEAPADAKAMAAKPAGNTGSKSSVQSQNATGATGELKDPAIGDTTGDGKVVNLDEEKIRAALAPLKAIELRAIGDQLRAGQSATVGDVVLTSKQQIQQFTDNLSKQGMVDMIVAVCLTNTPPQ